MPLTQARVLVSQRDFNPNSAIVVPLADSWTAFFDSHRNEWVAHAELYILCLRLRTDSYFFFHDDFEGSPNRGGSQFNACRFAGDVKERQVMSYKDRRWCFQHGGDPLPFENLSAYALPQKRERLTADMLRDYGKSLGLSFWDPDAYGQNVAYLCWGENPPPALDSALKWILRIFGRPNKIIDRHGSRKPPD
jgi:hypothetical protein